MGVIGYKAFNADLTCRGFQYRVGEVFEEDCEPVLCRQGFHFCKTIADVYKFYPTSDNTRICKVEAIGDIDDDGGVKLCTNKIKILEEITDVAVKKCNSNASSSGFFNTGDCNTGNRNTGNRNTGDWNTGDCNTGDCNTGNRNTGDCNTGDCNTGNRNTGDCNTGDWNTGNRNTGDCNTGNRNTGDCNTGDCNTGDWNTGNRNTGDWNTGDCNTGNRNTGDCNTGDWNSTDHSTGVFNTKEATILMFNKPSDWTFNDWSNSGSRWYLLDMPTEYTDTEFVADYEMTDEEKKAHPEYVTIGGYLKTVHREADVQTWWNTLATYKKDAIKSLPNFDAEIFKEITGITV